MIECLEKELDFLDNLSDFEIEGSNRNCYI